MRICRKLLEFSGRCRCFYLSDVIIGKAIQAGIIKVGQFNVRQFDAIHSINGEIACSPQNPGNLDFEWMAGYIGYDPDLIGFKLAFTLNTLSKMSLGIFQDSRVAF